MYVITNRDVRLNKKGLDQFGSKRISEGWSDSVTDRVGRNLGKALSDFGFFE